MFHLLWCCCLLLREDRGGQQRTIEDSERTTEDNGGQLPLDRGQTEDRQRTDRGQKIKAFLTVIGMLRMVYGTVQSCA